MIDFLKNLVKPDIKPLNYIKIHKNNIVHNLWIIQSWQKDAEIWPVLKSNAYGHWLKEVSGILKNTSGKYICVDSFPEYQIAKKYSWKKILVLWETRNQNYKYYDFSQTTFCVYNLQTLNFLESLNKKITIHLFLNTWMNREWFQEDELRLACEKFKKSKLILEWVCSHFSSADEENFEVSEKQIEEFKSLYEIIVSYDLDPKYRHIWASGWVAKLEDDFFNAFRPGVALFWINVFHRSDSYFKKSEKLLPAMEIFSTILNTQKVASNSWISYNHTYCFSQDSQWAVVAFGYFEGFTRKMSNNYCVKIAKKYFPMRGNICMNLSTIEIWDEKIHIWDEVEILSISKKAKNNIYHFAESSGTSPYEILVKIQPNIRRIVE